MAIGIRSRAIARWFTPIIALLVVFQLAACGDKEPEQRKAFIDYLENTVMRSGQNLPSLSEDQKQKLGNYASDYDIILTFSRQFKQLTENSLIPAVNEIGQIRVPQDYVLQRGALQQSVGALNLLGAQIQGVKSKADTAMAALKQPSDLQVVYARVYAKVVTTPANILIPVVPAFGSFIQDIISVSDFLSQPGSQASFADGGVQFTTEQQAMQYNAMMSNLVQKQQAFLAAQKAAQGDYQ